MSTIKSSTLQAMIDEVAQDFADAVALKRESLQKSELRKDFPPTKEEGSESKPDASPDDSASPSPDADGSPDAAPAAPDASPAPAPTGDPGMGDPGMGDPAAEAALDPAALQAEYAKLQPDELEMHLQAAMAAKAALSGGAPAPGMDPAAAAGAPPAPAPAAPAPEMKSEGDMEKSAMEKSVIAKSEALGKAEAETTELKKLLKAQSEEIASLQAGIQKFVDVPARKAVTTVSHVTREVAAPSSKEFTKESIHAHLTKISATPALKKSDRQLINDFYCGVVKIDKLAHLFEENK